MRLPADIFQRDTQHARQGRVAMLHRVVSRQDQDAIRHGVQHGRHAALFEAHPRVKLRIVDGNGGLVGKALQQGSIVGRKDAQVVTEDEDHPDHLAAGDQRQHHAGQETQAGGACQALQKAVDLGQLVAPGVFMFRDIIQQRL